MTNYFKLLYGQSAHTNINVYLVISSKKFVDHASDENI